VIKIGMPMSGQSIHACETTVKMTRRRLGPFLGSELLVPLLLWNCLSLIYSRNLYFLSRIYLTTNRSEHILDSRSECDCTLQMTRGRHEDYENVPKSFRTGRLERNLPLDAVVSLFCVSFAAIKLCVASQRVFLL
jgi:hypothetical protein